MDDKDKRKVAKEYLLQIRRMGERIKELEMDIAENRERLFLPARTFRERVRGSCQHDTFEKKMAACLDKQLKHDELVFEYELLRDDMLMKVLALDDEECLFSQVLHKVYFKDMKMQDVANDMHYHVSRIFHVHSLALKSFYEKYLAQNHPDQ